MVENTSVPEREAVRAVARYRAAQGAVEDTREELATRVAAWVKAGATQRAVASRLGISHPTVGALLDRAGHIRHTSAPSAPQTNVDTTIDRTRDADGAEHIKRPVPMLRLADLDDYLPAFGDVREAYVAFSSLDVLLESGLHPAAFAYSSLVEPPTMLLRNDRGEAIGVQDCNAGYNGTGPGNAEQVLRELGWPEDVAEQVYQYRFMHLSRERVERTELNPLSIAGPGRLRLIDGKPTVVVDAGTMRLAAPIGPLQSGEQDDPWRERNGESHRLEDWITTLLNREPRLPWADGERVARCYLDREVAEAHGLRVPTAFGASEVLSVIVEQGEAQLWFPAVFPLDWTEYISKEAYRLLAAAGLYPDESTAAHPHAWLRRLLAGRRRRPPYIDLSPSGASSLNRQPAPLSEDDWG